jgi:hypothetical protein
MRLAIRYGVIGSSISLLAFGHKNRTLRNHWHLKAEQPMLIIKDTVLKSTKKLIIA